MMITKIFEMIGENLVSIVLFGSRARKNYSENSDYDLLIVLENEKKYDFSEIRKFFLLNAGKKLDIHILTKKEIIENFENFSPLFVTMLLGKKILFDKEMFFQKAFNSFIKKMINQKIKYCEGGKIWEMDKIAKNLEILQ